MATPTQAARDKLLDDFKAVITDTEELLHATANQTGERVATARARVEERLTQAKEEMAGLGDEALARGREAARSTDTYVRSHPWESIGIAAAVGLLVGLFTRRH